MLLALAAVTLLADAAIAFVHVGVEFGWWRSPLPECAAPHFSGGSIADRLASMPANPAKPCDQPTFLIPVPADLDGHDESVVRAGLRRPARDLRLAW